MGSMDRHLVARIIFMSLAKEQIFLVQGSGPGKVLLHLRNRKMKFSRVVGEVLEVQHLLKLRGWSSPLIQQRKILCFQLRLVLHKVGLLKSRKVGSWGSGHFLSIKTTTQYPLKTKVPHF